MNAVFLSRSITVSSNPSTPPEGAEGTPSDAMAASKVNVHPVRTLVIPSLITARSDSAPIDQESMAATKTLFFSNSSVAALCPIVLVASHDVAVINELIDIALDPEKLCARECLAALAATDLKQRPIIERLLGMLSEPGRERTFALKALSSTSDQSVTDKLLELVEAETLPADGDRVVDALMNIPRNDERVGVAYLRLFTEWTTENQVSELIFERAFAVGACKTGPLQMDVGASKIRAALTPEQTLAWESHLKALLDRNVLPEQGCLMLGNTKDPIMKVWLTDLAVLSSRSNEVRACAAYGARDVTSSTPIAACGGRSSLSHLEESLLSEILRGSSAKLGVAFRGSTWEYGVQQHIQLLRKGSGDAQAFAAHALIGSPNAKAQEALIDAAVNSDSAKVRTIAQWGLTAKDLFQWKGKLFESIRRGAPAEEVVELSRVFGDDPTFAEAFVSRVVSVGGVQDGEFVAQHFSSGKGRAALARALQLVK